MLVTVKPVYYGHLGTSTKCLDYAGVHAYFQVSTLTGFTVLQFLLNRPHELIIAWLLLC